jgi:hypothetical protein
MHLLRNHTRFLGLVGRWVLLWFVLSLGVATASPIVHPQAVELVCSSAGSIKVVVHTEDGAQEMGASHIDCPLCVLTGAPPPAPVCSVFRSAPAVGPRGPAHSRRAPCRGHRGAVAGARASDLLLKLSKP